ncbi:uncharacterized protein [Triticum aestivum]|nr:uncharacterized protein LOC123078867 [Triticum aestivum]
MSNWQCSTVSEAKLRALVDAGMLPCLTEAREWIKPMLEDSPRPSQGTSRATTRRRSGALASGSSGGNPMAINGPLTSSNSGWRSEWFYLKNDPECPLPVFTGGLHDTTPAAWSDGPEKKKQAKLLHGCPAAVTALQARGVDLATVIGGYLARGVVPLRRPALRLFEMTADRAPFGEN